jgi:GTP-binding protein Era
MNNLTEHKAGFVSIIGKPNAGKSTLMNQLVGERLSIITPKAQTTRHRVMGILSGDNYQIIYSDTPGIIEPKYELQKSMMSFVDFSLEDADMILWVVDLTDQEGAERVLERLEKVDVPVLVILNKMDTSDQTKVVEAMAKWQEVFPKADMVVPVSATEKYNTETVMNWVLEKLPNHPPYYDKDELTDRPERFFASEMIREKVFELYSQEIPYSTEVVIESFKEEPTIIRIQAVIYVERDSQKGIIIGKGGDSLKRMATGARKSMETFFGKKIFLETFVKVEKDWRSKDRILKQFGYKLD